MQVKIKKLVITYDTSKVDGNLTVNGTASTFVIASNNKVETINLESVDSVTLQNNSSAQVKIASVSVEYEVVAA